MSLSRIVGQDKAIDLLTSAFDSGRLSHAYLFHGPDGVGKETTAIEFARALNCGTGGLSACGECKSCRMVESLSHPDLHLVFPVPGSLKPAELTELLKSYVRDGYRDQDFGRKNAIISVEAILEEVVTRANQRPYFGPWKVFIIADADMMTTEAANTLLKTLEEPPDDTVIVLTSSRANALPATVVSRCQKIPFAGLPEETIEHILLSEPRFSLDPEGAGRAARLAQGSAGRAVRMEKQGPAVDLDRVASLMSGDRTRDVAGLINEAHGLAFRLGRTEQQRLLELMLLWYRDVLRVSQTDGSNGGRGLVYATHLDKLRTQARGMDVEALGRLVDRLEEARRAIERYSNPTIVFTSVLLDVAIARKQATKNRSGRHAT